MCYSKKEIVVSYDNAHFIGIVSIVFLNRLRNFTLNTKSEFLVFFVYFLGVFLHELSHYFVAKITFGKPTNFTVLPKKMEHIDGSCSWTFGSVISRNVNYFNAFFIGLSPLVLLLIAYVTYQHYFEYVSYEPLNIVLFYVILYYVMYNSIPSSVDLKLGLMEYPFMSFIYLVISVIIYLNSNYLKEIFYESLQVIIYVAYWFK